MAGANRVVKRSPELAWLVTAPLAVLTAALTIYIANASLHPVGRWWLAALFFGLFLMADLSGLRFEVRRQTFVLTLIEIPLLLGLFYLPPVTFILVRVAAVAAIQVKRGLAPVKAVFNIALAWTTAACATLVLVAFGEGKEINPDLWLENPSNWLLLAFAVSVGVLVSLLGVVGVVTLVQGSIPTPSSCWHRGAGHTSWG